MKNVLAVFKSFARSRSGKAFCMLALVLGVMAVGAVDSFASTGPNTGDADVDTIISEFEGGFGTAKNAFTYLAIAAIPVTLIVVLFFWIRGKFKQSVSGA